MTKSLIQTRAEWLEALQDAGVSTSAFAVAFAIGRCLNSQTGDAWPSQQWIAVKTGLSVRQVRDLIKGLRDAGFLVTSRRGHHKSSRYTLPEQMPASRPAADRRSGAISMNADRQQAAGQRGDGPPPNPSIEPSEKYSAADRQKDWNGPAEILEIIEAARGSEFVSSYLARSAWDGGRREIRPWSGTARQCLLELSEELGAIGVAVGRHDIRGPLPRGRQGEGVSKVQEVAI